MKNLYLLRKQRRRITVRRLIKWACMLGIALGCLAILPIWGGMEYGPLLIGRRLMLTAVDVAVVFAFAAVGGIMEDKMGHYEEVCALIEAQQKKSQEGSAPWVVGEQLKEIALREPASAELLAQNLTVEAMSIVAAEKKIKVYADKHKVGNFAYVSPQVAEGILRKFYGLDKAEEPPAPKEAPTSFNLADFLM